MLSMHLSFLKDASYTTTRRFLCIVVPSRLVLFVCRCRHFTWETGRYSTVLLLVLLVQFLLLLPPLSQVWGVGRTEQKNKHSDYISNQGCITAGAVPVKDIYSYARFQEPTQTHTLGLSPIHGTFLKGCCFQERSKNYYYDYYYF